MLCDHCVRLCVVFFIGCLVFSASTRHHDLFHHGLEICRGQIHGSFLCLVFTIVSLLQDFAVDVKGVTCVLNCLLHVCKEDVSLFYFQILSWFGCIEMWCKIF